MSEWKPLRLGDYSKIGRGSSPRPIKDQAYFEEGTIPWIKIADATSSFKYIYETRQYVNEYGASFSRKLPPESLIVAASGTLGFAIFLGVEGCVHDGWLYFQDIDENHLDKQFLYYLLNTLTSSFNSFSYGAAIQNINTTILRNTIFNCPPLLTQKKTAAILSAYDDLIENNNQRIVLLEQAAEEIYREWFVRMRFPGWETAKFEKGVPVGWNVKQLKSLAKHNRKSLRKGQDVDYINYVDIASVTTHRINEIKVLPFANAPSRARRIVQHGDIIWSTVRPANRAYCLILNPAENLIVSTGFVTLTPKPKIPFSYLYLAVTTNAFVEHIANVAKGAAYPAASVDDFEKSALLVPSEVLLENFDRRCTPLFMQCDTLQEKNTKLQQARNLLLSRLISGKLPVDELDVHFPPSMTQAEEPAHA